MAQYEYNGTLEEIDVTSSQAHQYEEMLDKMEAQRRDASKMFVGESFMVVRDNKGFIPCYRDDSNKWHYFNKQSKMFANGGSYACVAMRLETQEQAIAFIEEFIASMQWGGFAAPTVPTVETRKQITETTLIEFCGGKVWPMYKTASGRYAYYKLNANKNRSFKSEKGALAWMSKQQ